METKEQDALTKKAAAFFATVEPSQLPRFYFLIKAEAPVEEFTDAMSERWLTHKSLWAALIFGILSFGLSVAFLPRTVGGTYYLDLGAYALIGVLMTILSLVFPMLFTAFILGKKLHKFHKLVNGNFRSPEYERTLLLAHSIVCNHFLAKRTDLHPAQMREFLKFGENLGVTYLADRNESYFNEARLL